MPSSYWYVEHAWPRFEDSHPLSTSHCGICLFHIDNLHVLPVTLPTYDTFEFLSVYLNGSDINSLVIVLYCPGLATITEKFFELFTDFLEGAMSYRSVIIAGNVNTLLENYVDPHPLKLQKIL